MNSDFNHENMSYVIGHEYGMRRIAAGDSISQLLGESLHILATTDCSPMAMGFSRAILDEHNRVSTVLGGWDPQTETFPSIEAM